MLLFPQSFWSNVEELFSDKKIRKIFLDKRVSIYVNKLVDFIICVMNIIFFIEL